MDKFQLEDCGAQTWLTGWEQPIIWFHFYCTSMLHSYAEHNMDIAIPSVSLAKHLYCVKTTKTIIEQSRLHGSLGTVDFSHQSIWGNSTGDAKYRWEQENRWFSTNVSLYLRNGTWQANSCDRRKETVIHNLSNGTISLNDPCWIVIIPVEMRLSVFCIF